MKRPPTNKQEGIEMAPLRKIVDYFTDPETGAQKERLECGHILHRKQDIYGYTTAVKRRCRYCERER